MKAWRRYLRFWGPDIDADVNDELQFHVEARITEYEARGFSRDQDVRMARERFGDVSRIGGQLVATGTIKLSGPAPDDGAVRSKRARSGGSS